MRKRDKKELRKKERKRERGRQMYFTAKCNVTRDILWGETGKFSRSQKSFQNVGKVSFDSRFASSSH